MFFASTNWIAQFSVKRAVEGSRHSGKGGKRQRGRQTNGLANCKRGPDCAIRLRQGISVPPGVSWYTYQSALETACINVVAGVYPIPRPYRRKVAVSSRGRENRANSPGPRQASRSPTKIDLQFSSERAWKRERHGAVDRGSCVSREYAVRCN